jgi:uncharacterized protein (TIGR02284 family)
MQIQDKEQTIDILNDLIKINNDRIEGYRRAISEAGDLNIDLRAAFVNFIADSESYREELVEKVRALGGNPSDDSTTLSGKIYRMWMDVKATFSGSDRLSILESCEFGEDAAQKAYQQALEEGVTMSQDIFTMISEQKDALRKAHNLVRNYRDLHDAK